MRLAEWQPWALAVPSIRSLSLEAALLPARSTLLASTATGRSRSSFAGGGRAGLLACCAVMINLSGSTPRWRSCLLVDERRRRCGRRRLVVGGGCVGRRAAGVPCLRARWPHLLHRSGRGRSYAARCDSLVNRFGRASASTCSPCRGRGGEKGSVCSCCSPRSLVGSPLLVRLWRGGRGGCVSASWNFPLPTTTCTRPAALDPWRAPAVERQLVLRASVCLVACRRVAVCHGRRDRPLWF